MSGKQAHVESAKAVPPVGFTLEDKKWFAIHTMARHEKRVSGQLQEKAVITFLPLLQQVHRWSDRRREVEVPLFSCYVFVQMAQSAEERLKILQTPGVLGFVGTERIGTSIPKQEIENLQITMREKIPFAVHPFITVGKRVRIRGGSMEGVEGILVGQAGGERLVVSVELLQRSVSIQVKGYDIELA